MSLALLLFVAGGGIWLGVYMHLAKKQAEQERRAIRDNLAKCKEEMKEEVDRIIAKVASLSEEHDEQADLIQVERQELEKKLGELESLLRDQKPPTPELKPTIEPLERLNEIRGEL